VPSEKERKYGKQRAKQVGNGLWEIVSLFIWYSFSIFEKERKEIHEKKCEVVCLDTSG